MIEQPSNLLIQQEQILNQELSEYRKVNFHLRRRLKEKDQKIWSLLGIIEQTAKPIPITPMPPKKKHIRQQDYSIKLSLSQHKKQKQKSSRFNAEQQKQNLFQTNIFKDESALSFKKELLRLKLPTIQPKSRFQNSNQQGNEQRQRKKVKIALDKLKPLERSEVKRRFLQRYKNSAAENQ